MRPQQTRVSPLGRRRPISPLGPALLAAANTEIAERLYLAETTVKTHVGHILSKLNLRDRVSMVITAYDAGLVRPGR